MGGLQSRDEVLDFRVCVRSNGSGGWLVVVWFKELIGVGVGVGW